MYTLLSVDWDFFFPNPMLISGPVSEHALLYDWGHKEALFFIKDAWLIRAASFIRNGLPLPTLSGDQTDFWSTLRIRQGAPLYVSESHMDAERVCRKTDAGVIYNFDAHHDLGYDDSREYSDCVTCDNWLAWCVRRGVRAHVIYPRWRFPMGRLRKDAEAESGVKAVYCLDGLRLRQSMPVFDAVFVCRSGAWVPSWLDDEFEAFLHRCPIKRRYKLGVNVPRTFNRDFAERLANLIVATS